MKLSELGRMLEKAAGVEGRELSPGERQAQLEKYRFRFVNIYQELEMSSRFVDTHRDVSQGGDGVQLQPYILRDDILYRRQYAVSAGNAAVPPAPR